MRKDPYQLTLLPIDADGAKIYVDWTQLHVGASFFVPCIKTVETKRIIHQMAKRIKATVVIEERIEKGMWGVRVWRTE
jgi:hypothetical protein